MARKARHDADPPHTSPAVAPPQHGMQGPTTANLPRHQHGAQDPTTTHNANTSHRTPPPCHPQHGMQNGAAVGMVAVVDSGMVAAGMAATAGHSYYLRLYIFYLCNKLILFLYFVIKATNILLLLSITDVKSNNNK